MSQLIDRRQSAKKKSTVNRQRFLRRYKQQIKKSVLDSLTKKNISDIAKDEAVTIPKKDLSEPRFRWGKGGVVDRILPGNKEYAKGDTIPRPQSSEGGASGGDASNQGEGEDSFQFYLTKEEFIDLYFDDLELPDMVRKDLGKMVTEKSIRAGIINSGIPVNINVVRSLRQALSRRLAITASYRKKLEKTAELLANLKGQDKKSQAKREEYLHKIEVLKRKMKAVPFIDTVDLRYNHRIKVMLPATQAVMFCVMDVSGSMDEVKKAIAKQFFILLYLFLTKTYENIEIIFIRHHTSAKEVNEQEFFYSRETGGTVVSSALEMVAELIETRFPPEMWNIYIAQASDGDNWNADSPYCETLLQKSIMPYVQYFTYIEIMPRHHQSLWEAYQAVQEAFPNFAMQHIENIEQIYPVFRELFTRKTA